MNSIYDHERWLSVQELAYRLGLGERTVKRLIYAGEIPARKFGRQWRIDPAVLVTDPTNPEGH